MDHGCLTGAMLRISGVSESVAKHVGATIRAVRNEQKISRKILAERAGLHPNYVGAMERGEMNAGIENIAKIARALKIPLYKLFLQSRTKSDPVFDEVPAIVATADAETLNLMAGLLRSVKKWKSDRKSPQE
jgi:transcriptional regulator with XRE-family HTH domain